MKTYEALFLIDANLDENASNAIFDQIKEIITKNDGDIISSRIWTDKQSLTFPIKKKQAAKYYLVNFKLKPVLIDKIRQAYRLNENILRVLITRGVVVEKAKVVLSKKE
ncbi:MAG: 30S ribosomal protein S6 [Candidatus Omnitrophota bacterium]|jgi:small subunit ribosomal protein S6